MAGETIVNTDPDPGDFNLGFDISNRWAFDHYNGKNRVYNLSGTEKRTYYTDNSLASYDVEHYDVSNNSKTDYIYKHYTYNTNQTLDSILCESFSIFSAPKPLKGGEKYIYNNSGQLVSIHSLFWDSTQSAWVDDGASDLFIYDNNGQLEKHIIPGDWDITYTYNSSEWKIADTAFFIWGNVLSNLSLYDYYPGGLLKSEEYFLYEPNQQTWIPQAKFIHDYNGNNCTGITTWGWDKTTNAYVQWDKTDYLYNSDNQIVQAGNTRYYYQFPATVETLAGKSNIYVYPNPAISNVDVDIMFDKPENFSVIVFDMQGRIAKQFTDHAKGHYKKSIIVQDMPAGQYMLQVNTAKETMSRNFTVIR